MSNTAASARSPQAALGLGLHLILLPILALALFVYLLLIYLFTFFPKSLTSRFFRPMARHWCLMFTKILRVDLKLEFAGDFKMPDQYVLVANHPSIFEDFGVPACFDIHPLAKAGVRDWFFLGRISEFGGTIFVHRRDRDSRKNALNAMKQAVSDGHNLVIFPEGGCLGKDIQSSFKTGAFETAIETGVPLLPVYLHYLDADAFEWADQSIPRKLLEIMFARDNRVRYVVHPPITSDACSDKFEFAEEVRLKYLKWQSEYRSRDWTWS